MVSSCIKATTYLFFLFSTIAVLHAQKNFELVKINAALYPEVTATFAAFDDQGNKIFNARPEDFTITENKQPAEVIDVQNPSMQPRPVSVVLVFDNSISMTGSRLRMAIKAGRYFIEQMPLETSEVAIASFSDKVYINCDFTQDPERLYSSLDNIKPVGGTNYTEAFMDRAMGSLSIAKNGQHKKYVIFLTDGLSHTDAKDVIAKAKQENITVFCITLELAAPQVLKEISTLTGGAYFQTNANSSQLDAIYGTIFQMLEVVRYGRVTWKAPMDCHSQREVNLMFRNTPFKITYQAPADRTGGLEADPTHVIFGAAYPGVTKKLSIDLLAKNIPITVTNIAIAPKSPFGTSDTLKFPLILKPNQAKNITLTYKAANNKQILEKMIISSKECEDKTVQLTGGTDEELKLLCPKGGETFVVDMDTSVRWAGIRKDKTIEILFKPNPKRDWQTIAQANGLEHLWKIPMDTGRRAQIKVRTVASPNDKLFLTSTVPNQKTGLRAAFFNNKGDRIITTDNAGIVKVWDTSNGMPVNTLKDFKTAGLAFFASDDKHIITSTKTEHIAWSVESNELVTRQIIQNKLVFAPLTLPDGSIKMIPSIALKDKANTIKLWRPETNHIQFIFETEPVKAAGMSLDASKAITVTNEGTVKIRDFGTGQSIKSRIQPISLQSIIISPNTKTAMIVAMGSVTIMDMATGAPLHENKGYVLPWYSKSGDMLITKNDPSRYIFTDTYTGKLLFNLYKSNYFETLSKYNILFYRNDSLTLYNALEKRKIFQKYYPSISYVTLSPDETKIMIVYWSNVVELLDAENGTRLNRIATLDGDVQYVLFSPDSKSMVAVMKNNSLQYWSPEGLLNVKEATSGYFTIISPKPLIKKSVEFGYQYQKESKELVVDDFIKNPTSYPIKISKIEILTEKSQDFEIVSETGSFILEPGSIKSAEFRFRPETIGSKNVWVRTCTPKDTFLTILKGEAVARLIQATSESIDFGKVNIHTTRDTLAVIIKNTGESPLKLNKIDNFGPDITQFKLLQGSANTVLPGDSLLAEIRFAPIFRGKTSGALQISIEGLNSPQLVQLAGEGVASRKVWIAGKTLNSSDSIPLMAKVIITDLASNTVITEVQSDAKGKYKYQVNTDRNYGIIAEKKGYLSTSENIDIRSAIRTDTIYRNIFLTEVKTGAMIRMNCIFFEFAKANLLTTSRSELNRIAEFIKTHKLMMVELHGHTDSIGTDASNQVLAEKRANAVRDYLIKQGVIPKQLSIKAYGESKPVSINSTEEGRQLNRRVEMKILQ